MRNYVSYPLRAGKRNPSRHLGRTALTVRTEAGILGRVGVENIAVTGIVTDVGVALTGTVAGVAPPPVLAVARGTAAPLLVGIGIEGTAPVVVVVVVAEEEGPVKSLTLRNLRNASDREKLNVCSVRLVL